MDSVEVAHRERVEALLPRVDAVLWVTDPEKYHDAVLQDEFLREWLPRLDRQAIVLNKTDRLAAADVVALRRDLERDLATRLALPDGRRPPVLAASAAAGEDGLRELRAWLPRTRGEADRPRRLAATMATAVRASPRRTAWTPPRRRAFLEPGARRTAIGGCRSRSSTPRLAVLERQAVAATRARARARGTRAHGRRHVRPLRLYGRESRVAIRTGFSSDGATGDADPRGRALRQAVAGRSRSRRPPSARRSRPGGAGRHAPGLAAAVIAPSRATTGWCPRAGLCRSSAPPDARELAIALSAAWSSVVLTRPPVASATCAARRCRCRSSPSRVRPSPATSCPNPRAARGLWGVVGPRGSAARRAAVERECRARAGPDRSPGSRAAGLWSAAAATRA